MLTLAVTRPVLTAELSLRSLYIQWVALSVAALYCLRAHARRLSRRRQVAWRWILLVTAAVFFAARAGLRSVRALMPAAHHLAIAGIVGAVLLRYLHEQHREGSASWLNERLQHCRRGSVRISRSTA